MNKLEKIPKAKIPTDKIDIWNLPELDIADGRFKADWNSLEGYQAPDWFRDGKFGFWSHWDPQSVPEEGDWYARWMYDGNHKDNKYHRENYGDPSEFGYKDICGMFSAEAFDPEAVIELVKSTGAKYFLSLANHHDNYDNFDSKYQPWNSVNVGAFKDIVGMWFDAARKAGLKVGVSYHATPGRVWGQFMPVRYGTEFPGDGTLTKEDGIGKWWEGLDPVDLYGPVHSVDDDPLESPFANQFMHRVNDLMKYRPDLICFDESVGNLRDLGAKMGLGLDRLSPKLLANYYNQNMKWNDGVLEGVMTMKDIGGMYNSVSDRSMFRTLHQAFINGIEKGTEDEIAEYPFQTEDSLADWHYQKGMEYKSAEYIITQLADVISRNGNLAICIPQHGDGSIDPISVEICKKIGDWMSINGEAVFGSRPFEVYGEGNVRYTRKQGYVYAFLPEAEEEKLILSRLGSSSVTLGKAVEVTVLGCTEQIQFTQERDRMEITLPEAVRGKQPIVIKIASEKAWINDDDTGIKYDGWMHTYKVDSGNYNNDLHIAKHLGATATLTVEGTGVEVYAAKGPEYGALEFRLDGKWIGTSCLYAKEIDSCAKVFDTSWKEGKHVFEIISAHGSPANLDAIVVKNEL